MKAILTYSLLSSICLCLSYVVFRIIVFRSTDLKWMRFFIHLSLFLSLVIPLSPYTFNISGLVNSTVKEYGKTVAKNEIASALNKHDPMQPNSLASPVSVNNFHNVDWIMTVFSVYLVVAVLLFLRILFQLFRLTLMILRGASEKREGYTLVKYHGLNSGFSFLHWIFINSKEEEDGTFENIIAHERAHANQLHSVDTMVVNFVSCLMWFNPFIWLLRDSLQMVHEYLADEAVLDSGVDKIRYQTVLLNQVAEGPVLSLAAGFNRSLIKDRIAMMTTKKTNGRISSKILMMVFVSGFLFITAGCLKRDKQESGNVLKNNASGIYAAVAPVKMNVLYLGVENPIDIAVSGIPSEDIGVSIDNGTIRKDEAGRFIAAPANQGEAKIILKKGNEEIGTKIFRVKLLPTPIASIGGTVGGRITKGGLLNAGGINCSITNFDFDVSTKVVYFKLSVIGEGKSIKEYVSKSSEFTPEQVQMIKGIKQGQKIYFEGILGSLPDGTIRELGGIILTVD
ncbi:MAG: GldM family protein [Bacteroidales bacterium]